MTALKLPRDLADLDLKLGKALNAPLREIWPEETKFIAAEQPEAIAKVLIQTPLHNRLVNAKLAFLFRQDISQAGRARLALTSKAGAQLQHLTGYDFVLTYNHEAWLKLTPEQRIATVDHSLCACDRDLETGAYQVLLPDVAEFSGVVARWGLWTPPLRGFGVAIESAQIELFVPQLEAAAAETEKRSGRGKGQRVGGGR